MMEAVTSFVLAFWPFEIATLYLPPTPANMRALLLSVACRENRKNHLCGCHKACKGGLFPRFAATRGLARGALRS